MSVKLLCARTVAPIDRPAIENGGVALENGLIRAVGLAVTLRSDFPHAQEVDYGDAVILPGLVNAHTHLELCLTQRPPVAGTFQDWIIATGAQVPRDVDALAARVRAATRYGARAFLAAGVTSLGDISQHCRISRAALGDYPGTIVSFGECLGLGARRGRFDELLGEAIGAPGCLAGISPHAPYTVDRAGYAAALAVDLRLCTHLAETPDEGRFLLDHGGAFGALYEQLGFSPGVPERFTGGPIRFAQSVGLLAAPALLAHVNYCDDDELALLAAGRASVAYCPRTHAYFGHPPHRWRDMLAAGMNVAVATDSIASSADLDLVAELRLLREIAPDVSAETLWRMATLNGAIALRLNQSVGSVTIGKRADLVVFDGRTLEAALNATTPGAIYVSGELIVSSTAAE